MYTYLRIQIKKNKIRVINTEKIYPPAVNLGEAPYPANVAETVHRFFTKVVPVDAAALALRAGNIHAVKHIKGAFLLVVFHARFEVVYLLCLLL
jgi:hypothetical protein